MAFKILKTVQEEMGWIDLMRKTNPDSADTVLANSKLLVNLAGQGEVRAIAEIIAHVSNLQDETLSYYYVKMFQEACINRRLDVLKLMIDNSFDVQHPFVRETLHRILEAVTTEVCVLIYP
jgi:hypothetical protein